MKTFSALTALLTLCLATSALAGEGWGTNYKQALEQAKKDHKLLLMDFTGSDWCGWCIKLDKEVFSQKAFRDYAAENLVLLKLDFPRRKSQSSELKKQNSKLADEFQITGYPTVVVLNSDGVKVGVLGYMEGGPAAFIAELDKLKNK